VDKPKVSVILPVFNGEKYINESIDSVSAQEYKNHELLICDDASSDKSIKIIESKKDKRITLLRNNTNIGLFRTLNSLIKASTGKYVKLWAQDDIMKRDCLKKEVRFYEKHSELGFCYSTCDDIDAYGNTIINVSKDTTPEIIPSGLAAQIMFYYGSIPGNISTVIIKKDVFDNTGMFRPDILLAADFEMWVRISQKYPIGFINEPLIKLRRHKGQLSRRKGAGLVFIKEQREIFAELEKRLPPEIKEHAKEYNDWHSSIRQTNYMIKSFLTCDFKMGWGTYKHLSKKSNIIAAIFRWLITANGRFFKKKPIFKEGEDINGL